MTPEHARILGSRYRVASVVLLVLWLAAWGIDFPLLGMIGGAPWLVFAWSNTHYGWADGYEHAKTEEEVSGDVR